MINHFFTFLIGAVLGLTPWLWTKLNNWRYEEKIYNWLSENTKDQNDYRFKSTIEICNGVNLENNIVASMCYKSKRIRRNEEEKETWTIFTIKNDKPSSGIELWN